MLSAGISGMICMIPRPQGIAGSECAVAIFGADISAAAERVAMTEIEVLLVDVIERRQAAIG